MDLETLGHAAATYQRDPRLLRIGLRVAQTERAAAEGRPTSSEARPELTLNGLAYFRVDDLERAVGWLAENDCKTLREAAAAAQRDA